MPKSRYKRINWKLYNKALINRGSLTFWIDEEAIAEWKKNKQGKHGRPRRFSDLAITTALMVKRVFSMPLRALQGFLDSEFKLANIPLVCPHYTYISRRAKEVEVLFKTKTRRAIQHLALDITSLRVYGEGEWKVKKHGTDGKRRVWRKLHISFDRSELTDSSRYVLAQIIERLQHDQTLKVEGHTDNIGSDEYNFSLGLRRAQSVADYLQQQSEQSMTIDTISYGEKRPLISNDTAQQRAKNRRVDIH